MNRLRETFGAAPLLVRRRLRRDSALLATWSLLVIAVVTVAMLAPRLVVDLLDAGAREAVAAAGSEADLVVSAPVGSPHPGSLEAVVPPGEIQPVADGLQHDLPPALATVADTTTLAIVSKPNSAVIADGSSSRVDLRVALLTTDVAGRVTLVSGRLPSGTAPDGAVEVAVSTAAAETAGLSLGSELTEEGVRLRIVGTVDPVVVRSPDDELAALSDVAGSVASGPTVLALADFESLTALEPGWDEPFTAVMRVSLDPAEFTGDLVESVSAESSALEVNSAPIVTGQYDLKVSSGFSDALGGFEAARQAASAQTSMLIVGVLGVAILVILLVGGLLVRRRAAEVELERARGASVAGVLVRIGAESILVAVIGTIGGFALSWALHPGAVLEPGLVTVAVLLSALGPVVISALALRRSAVGRTAAHDRRARAERARLLRARRISLEVTVLVITLLAALAVTGRGLLAQAGGNTDLLAAASPLLLAAAATILILRLQPLPVRLAATIAARTRGAFAILGIAHVRRSSKAMPVLALTLALGLAVGNVAIAATVRSGQIEASWQRIGADVRVNGPIAATDAEAVASAAGVSAASAMHVLSAAKLDLGTATTLATVLAVDEGYPSLVEQLPELPDVAGQREAGALNDLAEPRADGALAVVVDETLSSRLVSSDLSIEIGETSVPLHVVGRSEAGPSGYLNGPFLYVDLAALNARLPRPLAPDSLLAVGPGAAAAASSGEQTGVQTRTGWLSHERGGALVSGVSIGLAISSLAALALGMIGLIATVLAGARERLRAEALVRTLGGSRTLAVTASLAETVPLVAWSVLGGAAAGFGIVTLIGPALGLETLSGGTTEPSTVFPILAVVGSVALGLAFVAIAAVVDLVSARRTRLSDVLRVGDTR